MRERFNAQIDDSTLLRFSHFGEGDVLSDVFAVIGVDIYDEDPRINPLAVPIQTIAPGGVIHDGTGLYSYVMDVVSTAGVYFDKFKFINEEGDPETYEVQQVIMNQLFCVEQQPVLPTYGKCDKVGYTFNNYVVPANKWGVVGTPDDLRYTYLFGIQLVASNGQEATDEQLAYVINAATEEFETNLGICIRKKIFKTNPAGSLIRGREVGPGIDYTDEEDSYPFRPGSWINFGFLQLRRYPIISVERAKLYSITYSEIADLLGLNWFRLQKQSGQVYIYPKKETFVYGPPLMAAGAAWLWLRQIETQYPQGFEFDYTAGYVSSDYIERGLREVIMKLAAIGLLQWVGDGLMAGFSSSSISIDGMSEAFSSTQSATSAYFGARILSYQGEIKEWLKRNRYKYQNIPMAFA